MWEDTTLASAANVKVFAPHWTDVNYTTDSTPVFYNFYSFDEGSRFALARQRLVECGLDGFTPEVMITVTWTNTLPRVQFDSALDSVSKQSCACTSQFHILH